MHRDSCSHDAPEGTKRWESPLGTYYIQGTYKPTHGVIKLHEAPVLSLQTAHTQSATTREHSCLLAIRGYFLNV